MVYIFAPVKIQLPDELSRFDFDDFSIRKITDVERKLLLENLDGITDTFYLAEIEASMFCLALESEDSQDWKAQNRFSDILDNFRIALRLIGCDVTLSFYICIFGGGQGSASCLLPLHYTRVTSVALAFSFSKEKLNELQSIYSGVKSLSSGEKTKTKFLLLKERYEASLASAQRPCNRFIDAVIFLESLLLPGLDQGELTFRFSMIASKLLFQIDGTSKEQSFKEMKRFYKIRSEFVHTGASKTYQAEDLENLKKILNKFFCCYVSDKDIFEEEALEKLLIQ